MVARILNCSYDMKKHLKFHWITIRIDCTLLRSLKVVSKFDLNSYYHGQHNFLKVSQKYFYSTQTQSISSQCTKSTIKLSYATNFSQLSEVVVWVKKIADKSKCKTNLQLALSEVIFVVIRLIMTRYEDNSWL